MSPKIIGLTGGMACGKSTATRFLAELGWHIIDTDDLARDVVKPGEEGWNRIQETFGPDFFQADQTLNRKKLAETVFGNPEKLAQLNALLHPLIRQRWKQRAAELTARGQKTVVVIPLLFETGAEKELSPIVVIGCSEALAFQRAKARGWSKAHFQARLQGQWSLGQKINRADFVIWNEGSIELFKRQIQHLSRLLS